jgi:hypothetical protein
MSKEEGFLFPPVSMWAKYIISAVDEQPHVIIKPIRPAPKI